MSQHDKSANHLYSSEEEILKKASRTLSNLNASNEDIRLEFSSLIDSYSKLIRQTKKLVTISDRTQERLNQVSREKGEAYDKLNEVYSQLKEDLIFAQSIQKNILPRNLERFEGLDIAAYYKPMIEVGGDIYDIEELAPGHIRIFLADATGHGVQAALITMIIKSEYEKIKLSAQTPADVMKSMNAMLFDVYENLKQHFTAFCADVKLSDKKITFSSAGHPEQYVLIDGSLEKLLAKGIILGFMPNCDYQLGEITYTESFKLFLFTDGIYEEFDSSFNEYGLERIKSHIINSSSSPSAHIASEIIEGVCTFVEGSDLNDDMLLITAQNC